MGILGGKGALVTGGSRGIGWAIVKRLAGDGGSAARGGGPRAPNLG
jgi:NAD(P)-dependent dehydrogenase (short-subunit alcohol dehydrogenase family)